MTDMLTKLVNLWLVSRIDELMPWNCAAKRLTPGRSGSFDRLPSGGASSILGPPASPC
jgi:hypothetical protein